MRKNDSANADQAGGGAMSGKERGAWLLEWTQKLLVFLKGDDGLPTVKLVVASLLLFGTMDLIDAYTNSDYSWTGQEKLIALGIVAATRVLSLLITTKK